MQIISLEGKKYVEYDGLAVAKTPSGDILAVSPLIRGDNVQEVMEALSGDCDCESCVDAKKISPDDIGMSSFNNIEEVIDRIAKRIDEEMRNNNDNDMSSDP